MDNKRWAIAGALTGLAGALLLATAGGWALGYHGLWAFGYLVFVPWPVRLTMATLLLAATALGARGIHVGPSPFTLAPRWRWLAVPVAGLCFWLFRERTYTGDALLKLQLLGSGSIQQDPYVWKEPLDALLAYTATGLLRPWGGAPADAVAALSVLAGMVYVAATLYVAGLLADRPGERVRYEVGLLALGSAQLWFGHVENYSLVTAAAFAATALALGHLSGRNTLWPVGLMGGLAVSLHPQALFTLPALLLLLDRRDWPRQALTLSAGSLAAPLLTVLALRGLGVPWPQMGNGFAGDNQLFWTLAQALDTAQLADALNNLWLVAPLAPLWLITGLSAVAQRRRDVRFGYLTALAAGLLTYHFSFQNDLPRPQDWDLFAIVGPGFTLWGLYAWEGGQRGARRAVAWPALLFAVLFTVGWVGVNHQLTLIRPRSEQRELYAQYRLLDLAARLGDAAITPAEPICAEPVGCERVALTTFTMPQDGDTRPAIFAHAPARIVLPLTLPRERAFLWLSPALDPDAWGWGGDGVTFEVAVEADGVETRLWSRHLSPDNPQDRRWHEALIPLDAYRGRPVRLILATLPGPANDDAADRAGWGLPWLMRGAPDTRYDR